jgi:hypothetical protein
MTPARLRTVAKLCAIVADNSRSLRHRQQAVVHLARIYRRQGRAKKATPRKRELIQSHSNPPG